jgi:hypothetical protein
VTHNWYAGGFPHVPAIMPAKRFSSCVIGGEYILGADFKSDLNNGTVTFPSYTTSGVQYNIQDIFESYIACDICVQFVVNTIGVCKFEFQRATFVYFNTSQKCILPIICNSP